MKIIHICYTQVNTFQFHLSLCFYIRIIKTIDNFQRFNLVFNLISSVLICISIYQVVDEGVKKLEKLKPFHNSYQNSTYHEKLQKLKLDIFLLAYQLLEAVITVRSSFKLAKIIDQNSFQNFWLPWWNVYYGSECILAWGVFFKVREDSISVLACYIWWAPQRKNCKSQTIISKFLAVSSQLDGRFAINLERNCEQEK